MILITNNGIVDGDRWSDRQLVGLDALTSSALLPGSFGHFLYHVLHLRIPIRVLNASKHLCMEQIARLIFKELFTEKGLYCGLLCTAADKLWWGESKPTAILPLPGLYICCFFNHALHFGRPFL
jgi:hypothetical protein